MDGFSVLISTAGVGSRLKPLTDYTNKALVKVGDKPALSYIVELYSEDTKFVVTLGHFGDHVREFLTIAYPNRNFTFVEVSPYSGPGSSLGFSMLQAKNLLQCPFVFHACDTLLTTPVPAPTFNWCVGAERPDATQYTKLMVRDGGGVYLERGRYSDAGGIAYAGVCGVYDYTLFWDSLERAYHRDPFKSSLYDGDGFEAVIEQGKPVVFVSDPLWEDVGNPDALRCARGRFTETFYTLPKADEALFVVDGNVIKFFGNPDIVRGRVARADRLAGMVPVLESSTEHFYRYKLAEGALFSKTVNRPKFITFLEWAHSYLWLSGKTDSLSRSAFQEACRKQFIEKTLSRVDSYLGDAPDHPERINGIEIPAVGDLLNRIDEEWLCVGHNIRIHGDLILDNVLETADGFCLLDWRQDFGGRWDAGNIYYDLAKLNHNMVITHDVVRRGLFDAEAERCHILIDSALVECQKVLHTFIQDRGYDLRKVKVLTAMIWLSMAALHEPPFSHFLFRFGKYNLFKSLAYA